MNNEMIKFEELTQQIEVLEDTLKEMKAIEKKNKELKEQLFEAMYEAGIKKWESPQGVKVTLVEPQAGEYKEVVSFDERTFKKDNPDTYDLYLVREQKLCNSRRGYVKICLS